MSERPPIVVGIDGSQASFGTVRWAAGEAHLRGCPLQLVHAYTIPTFTTQPVLAPYDWMQIFESEAEAILSEARDTVRAEAPDLPVTTQVTNGGAARVLTDLSREATMVVVGHRGEGGFPALGLGSVAWRVAAHAHSPTVIIPLGTPPARTAPVVVGVDGSERNQAAVGFALEAASLRSVPLQAVHAWQPPPPPHRADTTYNPAEFATAARSQLRQWLALWQEKYPHVTTQLILGTGHPAACLLETARDAGLLVVGSRGRGGFSRLLLGSVSHQVILHASCPVAVLH